MEPDERRQLKDSLKSIIDGQGKVLDWNCEGAWEIIGITTPITFFEHLPAILPAGCTFYFEGCSMPFEVAALYASHKSADPKPISRDRLSPRPEVFHVSPNSQFLEMFATFCKVRRPSELCDHFKVYAGSALYLWFHDAFDRGDLTISLEVSETAISNFAAALGLSYKKRTLPAKGLGEEQARRFLALLENQEKPDRIPWWKRLFRSCRCQ